MHHADMLNDRLQKISKQQARGIITEWEAQVATLEACLDHKRPDLAELQIDLMNGLGVK